MYILIEHRVREVSLASVRVDQYASSPSAHTVGRSKSVHESSCLMFGLMIALGGLCTSFVQVQMVFRAVIEDTRDWCRVTKFFPFCLLTIPQRSFLALLYFVQPRLFVTGLTGIVRREVDKSIQIPKYDENPPPSPVECCPASAAKAPPGKSKSILRTIFGTILRTLSILPVHLM